MKDIKSDIRRKCKAQSFTIPGPHTCILGDDPGLTGAVYQQGVLQAAQLEGTGETLQEILLKPYHQVSLP